MTARVDNKSSTEIMGTLYRLNKKVPSFKDALKSRGWNERPNGQMEKGGLTLKESAEQFTELLSDSCSAGRESVTHDRETERLIEVIKYSEKDKS